MSCINIVQWNQCSASQTWRLEKWLEVTRFCDLVKWLGWVPVTWTLIWSHANFDLSHDSWLEMRLIFFRYFDSNKFSGAVCNNKIHKPCGVGHEWHFWDVICGWFLFLSRLQRRWQYVSRNKYVFTIRFFALVFFQQNNWRDDLKMTQVIAPMTWWLSSHLSWLDLWVTWLWNSMTCRTLKQTFLSHSKTAIVKDIAVHK